MDLASKILIVGGLANLAYGFLNGLMLSSVRLRSPDAPKYLVLAHMGALMQGPMLLGLVWALDLSPLSSTTETVAALLLVASSVVLGTKDMLNWLQGVRDEFAERSVGYYLGGLNVVLSSVGLVILIVGAVQGLWES